MKISAFVILLFSFAATLHAGQNMPMHEKPADAKKTIGMSRVSGVVQEKGTRNLIGKTKIHVRDMASKEIVCSVDTGDTGGFDFEVGPGEYMLLISAVGYDKFEQKISVKENENLELTLRAVPLVINPYRIVVRQKKRTGEVSTQKISIREASVVPGSNRDALNVVTNMPGVNSVSVFNGYGNGIVIRGSAQEDSLFYVEGHSIPAYYHFGGFESVIEPELVESLEYNAGGFSAEYGDTLGGVVAMNLKDPRDDRFGGFVNLGFLSSSFMLEGPISEKDSIAVSFKRGFLDYYMKMVNKVEEERTGEDLGFTKYPMYYDGSVICTHQFSKGNYLKFTVIGADDRFEFVNSEKEVSERYSDELKYSNNWITNIGEWHYKNGDIQSVLSPRIGVSRFDIDAGERSYHKQTVNDLGLNETLEYKADSVHTLKGGMKLSYYNVGIDASSFVAEKEGEVSDRYYDREMKLDKTFDIFYPEIFFMDQMKFGDFLVTPGVNALYDSHNEKAIVDPRISLKYWLDKESVLKCATGLYSKKPLWDETYEPWGTKGLSPERSVHGVAGIEHYFTSDIFMDVQAYYKHFYDMAVRVDEDDPTRYDNMGKGHAYGAEVLLRHNMTDNLFGWIAYTWSVAKRKDGPDKPERFFDSDITHNFKGVVSYKPSRYWSLGLRYEYASGTPHTDLYNVETVYDVENDEYNPVYDGPINDSRLKSHHRVDFRIDKYWLFDNWVLSAYLDVRNVFQNKYVTDVSYSKDYTEQEDALSLDSQVPLIFLGMKADF